MNDLLDARRRASMVVARFEIDVERGAGCVGAGLFQRDHLGVRAAGALVPAFTDDLLVLRDDATDARVRRGGVQPLLRQLEGTPHHGVVEGVTETLFATFFRRLHFCTASRKSSGLSKLR
jgi:hypothetical protein